MVMVEREASEQLAREVQSQLDSVVVGIELTLISIIQGLALAVLATSAVTPLVSWQVEYWPYIVTGLLAILIFWSRSLIHTLSFISWPLEFGHTFIYFGATLIEAVALTQVANPSNWFGLNALYSTATGLLYWYDLKVVHRHECDFRIPSERRLYQDIVSDQLLNIRLLMSAAVLFHLFSWWAIRTWPTQMLHNHWHVILGIGSVLVGSGYLYDGVRIFRRRQRWIVARYLQQRCEKAES